MRPRLTLLLSALLLACTGCVERRMLIRSDPVDAPVWIDEVYVGNTPVDYSFAHYGWRRVRIGPIRGEGERTLYQEKEFETKVVAPWYETFPIDFFAEVLYPGVLRDIHELPVIELDSAEIVPGSYDAQAVEELLQQAELMREQALRSVPEAIE